VRNVVPVATRTSQPCLRPKLRIRHRSARHRKSASRIGVRFRWAWRACAALRYVSMVLPLCSTESHGGRLWHTVFQLSPACCERADHFKRRVCICVEETRRLAILLVYDMRVAQSEYLPVVGVGDGGIYGLQYVALRCRHRCNLHHVCRMVQIEREEKATSHATVVTVKDSTRSSSRAPSRSGRRVSLVGLRQTAYRLWTRRLVYWTPYPCIEFAPFQVLPSQSHLVDMYLQRFIVPLQSGEHSRTSDLIVTKCKNIRRVSQAPADKSQEC
jgi:hypothetical protein